jgi:hypothetical protein
MARQYYIDNTNAVKDWSHCAAIEAFLRDTAFHRGVTGCCRIVQRALGCQVDGKFGNKTKAALALADIYPDDTITSLRKTCEDYERDVAPPIGGRAKFWPGLVNRWNKRAAFARTLL